MIVEAVRIVAAALADPATGVNARLLTMATDPGDEVPAVVAVLNAMSDDVAALGQAGARWPVLLVAPGGPFRVEGATPSGQRMTDPTMPVSVAYVSNDGDVAERLRQGEYTARAVMACVTGMGQPVRNGVCVLRVQTYDLDPLPTVTIAGAEVVMDVVCNLVVRDTTP